MVPSAPGPMSVAYGGNDESMQIQDGPHPDLAPRSAPNPRGYGPRPGGAAAGRDRENRAAAAGTGGVTPTTDISRPRPRPRRPVSWRSAEGWRSCLLTHPLRGLVVAVSLASVTSGYMSRIL